LSKRIAILDFSDQTPWKDSAGEIVGIIGVCRDVTERIEREKHILDMLSIATHDIRGPLSSIGSMIKLLIRGAFGAIDESVKVTLSDISGRMIRLEKLLGEYLCKSSIMNVKMPEKEYLDLREDIIDPILDEFLSEIEGNNIRIDNRLGAIPGNKITIKANARWIKIVYRNLIRNAIKYAASGQIAFGFEDKGDHYRLNIYNSGPPVPEERRTNIFEKLRVPTAQVLGLPSAGTLFKSTAAKCGMRTPGTIILILFSLFPNKAVSNNSALSYGPPSCSNHLIK